MNASSWRSWRHVLESASLLHARQTHSRWHSPYPPVGEGNQLAGSHQELEGTLRCEESNNFARMSFDLAKVQLNSGAEALLLTRRRSGVPSRCRWVTLLGVTLRGVARRGLWGVSGILRHFLTAWRGWGRRQVDQGPRRQGGPTSWQFLSSCQLGPSAPHE